MDIESEIISEIDESPFRIVENRFMYEIGEYAPYEYDTIDREEIIKLIIKDFKMVGIEYEKYLLVTMELQEKIRNFLNNMIINRETRHKSFKFMDDIYSELVKLNS